MDRRTLLSALGAAFLADADVSAGEDIRADLRERRQSQYGAHPHRTLIEEAAHCSAIAEVFQDHCHGLLEQGDHRLAECLKPAAAVVAVCTALRTLAAAQSPATAAQSQVAAQVCEACAESCGSAPGADEACRSLAQACINCAQECRLAAAA